MNKKTNDKGFSLVELIIVIAIMAILVGVLAPQFIKYIESSRQSTDISAASEYKSAIEAYVAEKGNITEDITVTITNTSGCTIYSNANLSDVGLAAGSSDATKLKSSGWPSATVTYNVTSFRWQNTSTITNTKQPGKNMSDAFN